MFLVFPPENSEVVSYFVTHHGLAVNELHFTKGNSRADVEAWMLWKGLSGKALADKLAALALRPSRGQFGGLRELEKLFAQVVRRNPGEAVTGGTMLEALKVLGGQS